MSAPKDSTGQSVPPNEKAHLRVGEMCCCYERTGWTAIKCCNICGYPMPTEPWKFTDTPNVRDERP